MQEYQIRYIENLKQIASLIDIYSFELTEFEDWYQKQMQARDCAAQLKKENIALLNDYFFPALDDLHNATKQDISELEEFADQLMDWKTNPDCGVYILIHDSLLSLYRFRKDRNGIIRELYKLGMGMFYRQRTVEGFDIERIRKYKFENEMVFTEAGSYLKYFEEIDDEQTQ